MSRENFFKLAFQNTLYDLNPHLWMELGRCAAWIELYESSRNNYASQTLSTQPQKEKLQLSFFKTVNRSLLGENYSYQENQDFQFCFEWLDHYLQEEKISLLSHEFFCLLNQKLFPVSKTQVNYAPGKVRSGEKSRFHELDELGEFPAGQECQSLLSEMNEWLEKEPIFSDLGLPGKILQSVFALIIFLKIHPFEEGNLRTGFLLSSCLLITHGISPRICELFLTSWFNKKNENTKQLKILDQTNLQDCLSFILEQWSDQLQQEIETMMDGQNRLEAHHLSKPSTKSNTFNEKKNNFGTADRFRKSLYTAKASK